uniref:Uncharacterized protein n=1 Tax=Romanomermis culicivorax TaxID=13658 RepID=A0A915JLL9_ROMCU
MSKSNIIINKKFSNTNNNDQKLMDKQLKLRWKGMTTGDFKFPLFKRSALLHLRRGFFCVSEYRSSNDYFMEILFKNDHFLQKIGIFVHIHTTIFYKKLTFLFRIDIL